jgi:uncharacterized protein YecE (DUF72 family)
MSNVDKSEVYVGCAGWSIHRDHVDRFPAEGTHLQRYAARFPAVEINSCFYRSHKPETYVKWSASVPPGFKFAVKLPKEISHIQGLDVGPALPKFLSEIKNLGTKLGPILVQLPPRLHFDLGVADQFFSALRNQFLGDIVCEPRHPTWFSPEVEHFLSEKKVARVAADPAVVPKAGEPGGWKGLAYFRLHGSPKIYYSAYADEYLQKLIRNLRELSRKGPVWCIFDNTALGEATNNAFSVWKRFME